MQTVTDKLVAHGLDAIIRTVPTPDGKPFPAPKEWVEVRMTKALIYVGDREYVIGFVEIPPISMEQMEETQEYTEKMVVSYLQKEGFIGEEYVYVGMQQFDLKNIPPDFLE